jgi:hypothetical protein
VKLVIGGHNAERSGPGQAAKKAMFQSNGECEALQRIVNWLC